jgi:ubiquitin carboxyl-terminal hydrolase 36/42
MPVSVHLLTDTLNNALSEKFTSQKKTEDNFSEQLVASAKRVILTKIEYEETTQNHNNVLEKLKSKYTILKLNPALAADVKSNNGNSNGGNATQSSYSNSSKQEKSNGLNGNEKNGSGMHEKP